ncbi:MAG: hypothetical protein GY847_18345 [Proteobacteria bacterium]|nr:hypothetical protein [Pseudomonadota bacterium]
MLGFWWTVYSVPNTGWMENVTTEVTMLCRYRFDQKYAHRKVQSNCMAGTTQTWTSLVTWMSFISLGARDSFTAVALREATFAGISNCQRR